MKKICFILALLTFGFCSLAFSDIICLKNGGKIEGEIIDKNDEKVKVKTSIAVITIERDSIDTIEIDKAEDEIKPIESKEELEVADSKEEDLKTTQDSISEKIEQAKAPPTRDNRFSQKRMRSFTYTAE